MARRSRRRRRSSGKRRGGFRGMSRIRGGFINAQVLGLAGGALGAGLLVTTSTLKKLPAALTNSNIKLAMTHLAIGAGGYMIARKWSPTAGYGILAVQLVRAVVAFKSANKKGLAGFGYIGTADGVDYGLQSDEDLLQGYLGSDDEYGMGYDDMASLGEYDAAAYEVA